MKRNLKRIVSFILAWSVLFNSGLNTVIANDEMGEYTYGSLAVVVRDKDDTAPKSEKGNSKSEEKSEKDEKIEQGSDESIESENETIPEKEKNNESEVKDSTELVEEKAKKEAEEKAKQEAETKKETEEKAKQEVETKKEAEEEAKQEAETKKEAQEKAKQEVETKKEAQEKAKQEVETKKEAEEETKQEAETKKEAQERTKQEAETKKEAEEEAKQEAETKKEAQEKSKQEAEAKKEAQDKEELIEKSSETVPLLSRDGNISRRLIRNKTSRGATSRAGGREPVDTNKDENEKVKSEVKLEVTDGIKASNIEDFKHIKIISKIEDKFDGEVVQYYELFSEEYDFEELEGSIYADYNDKEVVVVYVFDSEIIDDVIAKRVDNKYEFYISEIGCISRGYPTNTSIIDDIVTFASGSDVDKYHDNSEVSPDDIAYLNADFFSYDYNDYNEAAMGRAPGNNESLNGSGTLMFILQDKVDASNSTHDDEYYTDNVRNYYNYHYHIGGKNVLSQGFAGEAGSSLSEYGTPDFIFNDPGLFRKGSEYEYLLKRDVESVRFPFMKTKNEGYQFTSSTDHVHLNEKQSDKRSLILYHDTNSYYRRNPNKLSEGSWVYQQICERAIATTGWKYNNPVFWPFQRRDDTKLDINSGTDNQTAKEEKYNHFGVHLSGNFSLDKNGQVDNEDAIFRFSGDDDLWVYIDGKLALDVGGCHGEMTGEINFRSGEIKYGGLSYDGNSSPYVCTDRNCTGADTTTLKVASDWNLYSQDSKTGVKFDKNEFLKKSYHKIDIFYMERAEGSANCTMSFNFKTADEIISEKKAYVYDENTSREVDTDDSFALPNQDVYFELSVTNTSGLDLEDLVVYDDELNLLFDKEGIKSVGIQAQDASRYYNKLNSLDLSKLTLLHKWQDSEIKSIFESFNEGATVEINEDLGVNGKGTKADKDAIREHLTYKTPRFLVENGKYKDYLDYDNTIYSIAMVVLTDGSRVPTGSTADVEYRVKAPEINIRQIILNGDEKPEALVKTADIGLKFDSVVAKTDSEIEKVKYNNFKGYEFDKIYEILPIVNSNYELVEVTVDETKDKNKSRDTDTEADEFIFNDGTYERWITVYLKYKPDDNWHGDDAITNKFDNIKL